MAFADQQSSRSPLPCGYSRTVAGIQSTRSHRDDRYKVWKVLRRRIVVFFNIHLFHLIQSFYHLLSRVCLRANLWAMRHWCNSPSVTLNGSVKRRWGTNIEIFDKWWQTDRQACCNSMVRAMHRIALQKGAWSVKQWDFDQIIRWPTPCDCVSKNDPTLNFWNGIARKYMDRLWWYLAEISKRLYIRVVCFSFHVGLLVITLSSLKLHTENNVVRCGLQSAVERTFSCSTWDADLCE